MLPEPTEGARRAVHEAAARRRLGGAARPSWLEDEALALAAADPRNVPVIRALAWLAWAYNRSPLRVFLDTTDMPFLIAEGVLPPLWRRLVFLLLPGERAAEYRSSARKGPERSSGWLGCLVVLPVWAGLGFLASRALLAAL